ncbi:MAG TPA: ATP-binding protein [Candidatus Coatesbacteria bacterium]|nr:ATP-binding protein [Candidatus Coatesbacteria bacterium]
MLAKVFSAAVRGVEGYLVEVEADVSPGLSTFFTVGLPDVAVKESKDRVRAAVRNSGYDFAPGSYTVNLAPADMKKEGPAFDLPIALAVLIATRQIVAVRRDRLAVVGELSLDGALRGVHGILPIAVALRDEGFRALAVPKENAKEAALVDGLDVFALETLAQAAELLEGRLTPEPFKVDLQEEFSQAAHYAVDLSDVKGQEHAKRALEVAAAGGHNLLMMGPPGAGKTMLARRLPTILPKLSLDEALETTKVHSVAGMLPPNQALVATRPFRSPHHTISSAGLIGGGSYPRPGEVSLAHHGILFLDELPEFERHVLEVLRQPLEDRRVTIARAQVSLTFPAGFTLVASMNPCPCGYYGDPNHNCNCSPPSIRRYRSKISGPLLDRIDIHLEVPAVPYRELSAERSGEPSEVVCERVNAARERQQERYAGTGIHSNAGLTSKMIRAFCQPEPEAQQLLHQAVDRLGFSARAYDRVLKLARTIADLEGADNITAAHVSEGIAYRSLDRKFKI